MNLDIKNINKVYLAGIGGIGLSAIAYYFLNLGKEVEGSDLEKSEVTKRLLDQNIDIHFEQKSSNISADLDLFIYSSALPDDHPELVRAKELKIKILSYFQFLGELSKKYKTIAVAGTNGKTTTTAMIGLTLEKAGLDPTVIVGSLVPQWKSNFRLGSSDILVVEACEWRAHMLEIKPQIIVLTNVAEDHLDFYKNLADIKKHFQKFIDQLPSDGILIKNSDDKNSYDFRFAGRSITFGRGKADYAFKKIIINDYQQHFDIYKKDKVLANFTLQIPGEYNIYNALASITVADYMGINKHQIWNSLNSFQDTWRRFEKVGQFKSNIIISDYAHHPDSIRGLLKAVKSFYPDKQVIAVFQPHHHNRTKTLLKQFAKSFTLADQIIVSEIYKVSGREDRKQEKISSYDLVLAMDNSQAHYAKDFKEVKRIIRRINPVDSILLFIGAGDIDNLAREMVK
ncbi:MAG: UDP-N-acetylmuramate--L-alanine ligase [Candidatus Komeilibacteria bacterium CG11_big_fil_rev_8_21_14_0_20_36_20]|uniref:UDP-N-acetylmuramate--L-alanine ligase n=1 Tax=Candidatus Komeilibacteria bacterium CG11_big_fil_rev_8_21_14_0_20_36_20 TaxID=1974477 RepID=A0A2H0NC11_9BACT|nr:MAG: UDP-N-acetylmuramate--L-alanine ligase [Candidatus Komeilibacteria bacterium CG11_big_fil_rev_8_21_14_0_20_36_20]PIR82004.1 MAG: UDP-N-acetylmuramate--L-alanine ligase [Candidatus Komeilibacteria bacterium CG10_big_fil_rev_8_21_14_0_10_36_65]PJC55542.1 MAG: UDP-N-acetylmuramate--L-alanine ligase [Candidatus Komeilibacteria bacterium CG_4_9_14_0_2_um_filter_36_13]